MMLLPVGRMYIRMESAMSIIVDKISYVYEAGTGFERRALDNVSCAINDGEFVGLIGHTGSGKSTFIQHLNGLLKATEGHIYFNGQDIYDAGFNMKELRSKVGLVFQYPEHQLFETDIFKDVAIADGLSIVLKDMNKTQSGFKYVYSKNGNKIEIDADCPGDTLFSLNPRDVEITKKT